MSFVSLSLQDRRDIILLAQAKKKIQRQMIEKDWWVTAVLRSLFALPYATHLSFKGGTSLSKCWNLIERMSEDVDIAINREFLGFGGALSKTQISDKLRRASCSFVRNRLSSDLKENLLQNGIPQDTFSVTVNVTEVTTTDPETIEVSYTPIFADSSYIRPKILIEVSGRSMNEPLVPVQVNSFIDDVFGLSSFSEPWFSVNVVAPQRTFLEKVFLLHEEFSKPKEQIRIERMSRHLYDIGQMLDTPIAEEAIRDRELYDSVIEHRRKFIGLKGFDYASLRPCSLDIEPPESIRNAWKEDYKTMQETMIYGHSLPFEKLIEKIRRLNDSIRKVGEG